MVIYKSLLNPIKFLFVAGSKPPVPVIITGSIQPLQLGNKVWMKNHHFGDSEIASHTDNPKKQKHGALEVFDVGYPKHELLAYNGNYNHGNYHGMIIMVSNYYVY